MSTVLNSRGFKQQLTRAARVIRPAGARTVLYMLIALGIGFALLEIDSMCNGAIYSIWQWVWMRIFAYKSIVFALGMFTCYMLMRHQTLKRESGLKHSVFKQATLHMDVADLEEQARMMGIILHLEDSRPMESSSVNMSASPPASIAAVPAVSPVKPK